MGGPPAYIRSLLAGYGIIFRGAETSPMVEADGGGFSTEGYAKRYLGGRPGAEVTLIHQEWG